MLIKEFRTILPFSLEEYDHGRRLWNAALSNLRCEEIVREEPFTSTTLKPGKKLTGIYTQKLHRPRYGMPYFIRKIVPGIDTFYVESWDAYPYSKTVITQRYIKETFRVCIESYHVEDHGEQQNISGLSKDELKMRKVVFLDFANDKKVREFKSEKAGRGPLRKGWERNHSPIMCSYKVVTANFNWFGLQYFYESEIMKFCQDNFLFSYRSTYLIINSWCDLTPEQVQFFEEKLKEMRNNRKEESLKGSMAAVGGY